MSRKRLRHMNGFSVEESNFISIFAGESRTEVIEDISSALKYLEDDVLLELSERVLERLKNMSDEEFVGIDFVAAE